MKKFYCILTACLFCFVLTAQNVTEKTKKEMNRIKLSRSYICAEATMPTLQEAIDIANESLLQAIDQWVKEEKKYQGAKQVAIQDINSCLEKMDMNRGNNVRVLVYIKKKDIIPIYGTGRRNSATGTDKPGNAPIPAGTIETEARTAPAGPIGISRNCPGT